MLCREPNIAVYNTQLYIYERKIQLTVLPCMSKVVRILRLSYLIRTKLTVVKPLQMSNMKHQRPSLIRFYVYSLI